MLTQEQRDEIRKRYQGCEVVYASDLRRALDALDEMERALLELQGRDADERDLQEEATSGS